MIKFKYKLNNNISKLTIETFGECITSVYGYVDEAKLPNTDLLYNSSLFLLCNVDFNVGEEHPDSYSNPIAVVAKNQQEAIAVYNSIMNTNQGSVLCELEHRCDKLEVEAI